VDFSELSTAEHLRPRTVRVWTQTPCVRVELTVAFRGRDQDVVVEAPDCAAVASVRDELARAVGVDNAQLWHDDDPLAPTTRLSDSGLRTGSLLTFGRGRHRRAAPAVLSLHVVSGPSAGLIVPIERGRLTVGRAHDSDVVLADADASREHAVLDVTSTAITLHDLGSTNGTLVDARRAPSDGIELRPGGLVSIGDSLLTVAGPIDTPAAVQPAANGALLMLRPPRRQHVVPAREIELPTQSTSTRPRGVQWVGALLPAAAGGLVAWLLHSPQFLLFALLSPVMMVSTALGDRMHWRRSRRRDAATFRRRRAEAERQVADGLAVEADVRRAAAPDPAAILRQATLPGSRLWERRRGDDDLLRVRVGTASLASTLTTREGSTTSAAGGLNAVPACVDLRRGPLGVAGPPDVVAALGRWLVGQLAALHSPADVEFALLLAPDQCDGWTWARWLPQVRGRVATAEDEWSALVADLGVIVDQRLAERRLDPDGWRGPWLVLVIDRAGQLADVAGLAALVARGQAGGLAAICLDVDVARLPTACSTVVRVQGVTGTRLVLRRHADAADTPAVIDQVSVDWAAQLARGLAPLVDAGMSGASAIPADCSLADALGVPRIEPDFVAGRWAASRGGACSGLGRSEDGLLEIDLAADGPHALIAGTTGAGKSELLRTLVAGLATNHPPDELNVLLVDYKGGAAFAECARLPHTAGLVTDLDPYLTERALRALNSELRRRERLFADIGVDDLVGYRAAGPVEPIPRLVIVVDEFAALADELPEFMRGLIGVAQRGRSLGVHLVLATQRPGSAVSAEIRANTSLRIALRVTDPGESTDVIGSPVAASIDRSRPGHAYLRAGSALTCFQAAHASGTGTSEPNRVSVESLGPWRRLPQRDADTDDPTDLARLVGALRLTAERTGRTPARSPWLAPLPEALPRSVLEPLDVEKTIPLGLVDLPDEQRRATLEVDVGAGSSVLFAGASRSGRTGALVSLAVGAATHTDPGRLHLHVVDATGALAGLLKPLPHCATVLGPDDLALTPRLLRRLEREAARRTADGRESDQKPPSLVLLVDGWETVCAALPDIDVMACTEAVAGLLRIGHATGLTVAVTGDRSTLAPRFSGGFTERVLLRLADRADYGLAGISARNVPTALPPGRGLRATDGAVVQLVHAGKHPDPAALRDSVAAAAEHWASTRAELSVDAIRIRPLPTRVGLAELPAAKGRLSIGLAGDRLDPMTLDPFAGAGRMLVAGPPRSGRTTVLRSLAFQAHAAGIATLVAATSRSALADDARRLAIPVLGPADRDIGSVPQARTLLLVDDSEVFIDSAAGDRLTTWIRTGEAPLAVVVAGRADDLATSYRGIAAEVRRSQCGILLRPGPVDGELLGVRLPRRPSSGPPGRGVAVGDPTWGPLFEDGEPVPIQIAAP
jgi:S-DNA-T family DNA segregation ATPase FtsK/SpoIIIE